VAQAFVTEEGIVDREHGAAGIAEYEFDPLSDQAFDQDARAAALFTHTTFLLKFALLGGAGNRPETA
jgi:hypothetical protein